MSGKSDMRRTTAPPLDFAWKELSSFRDMLEEEPWTRAQEQDALRDMKRARDARDAADVGKTLEEQGGGDAGGEGSGEGKGSGGGDANASPRRAGVPVDEDTTLMKTSIKLDNNLIENWDGFGDAMSALLSDPQRLDFLDLSCNKVTEVGAPLAEFKSLTVLYLHGNSIANFKDLRVLKQLTELRKLTLHGNPVEAKKNYRLTVINALPKLKQLDFTPITALDRDKAETYGERQRRQREMQREAEGY